MRHNRVAARKTQYSLTINRERDDQSIQAEVWKRRVWWRRRNSMAR